MVGKKGKVSACKYQDVLGKCPRPVWEGGGPEEKYCLFHSMQMEKKSEEFLEEIKHIKKGEPSELYKMGQREGYDCGDFGGFRFPSGAGYFAGHKFEGDVYFSMSIFEGNADFTSAEIGGYAIFSYAKIDGYAIFFDAKIGGFASFSHAKIDGDAIFSSAKIDGYAIFFDAEIGGDASFFDAEIDGDASFSSAKIDGDAIFFDAKIGGYASSSSAKIGGYASFSSAKIGDDASFLNTKIEKSLILSGAKCGSDVILDQAQMKSLNANGLKYEGLLSLEETLFIEGAEQEPSTVNNVYLERTKIVRVDLSFFSFRGAFIREVLFDSVSFDKELPSKWFHIWKHPWVSGRPKEAICEERQALAEKEKTKKKEHYRSAETVYRTLKHEMEDKHAKGLARRMRAGELECKRNEAGVIQWFFLVIYRFLNGFGLRCIRALLFWLILIFMFACHYTGSFATYDKYEQKLQLQAGRFEKVERIRPELKVVDFGDGLLHSIQMTSVVMKPSLTIHYPDVGWIEFAERILSPALLLLFLQAARNMARD